MEIQQPSMDGWKESGIHFIGGAAGGTAGTFLTCPLEVVKTRLQSSHGHEVRRQLELEKLQRRQQQPFPSSSTRQGILFPRKLLQKTVVGRSLLSVHAEGGVRALFKGGLPNVMGVAPSKAIYFACYSTLKRWMNKPEPEWIIYKPSWFVPNSPLVHMGSAAGAAFVTATIMNPVWAVKTRLQLNPGKMGTKECVKRIRRQDGFRGFFRGLTGSWLGIGETIIQFVLYEILRDIIMDPKVSLIGKENGQNILQFMAAGGLAKLVAGSVWYPHEVIRTRLREENPMRVDKLVYHIWRNEGWKTFYRGLTVQLLRSVPNTAITMGTYELAVYFGHLWFGEPIVERRQEMAIEQEERRDSQRMMEQAETIERIEGERRQRISR